MVNLSSDQGYWPPVDAYQVQFHNWMQASMIAATTANLYDWFLTFSAEVRYIWCNHKLPKHIRILFFFMRYASLIVHIGQCIWTFIILADYYPVPLSTCKPYRVLEIAPPVILSGGADLLLLLRVWALFSRNKRLLYLLTILYIAQMVSIITITIPHAVGISTDELCIIYVPSTTRVRVAMTVVSFHTIAWIMTMHRCYFTLKRAWGRNIFAIQLMRDGTCIWLTLCTIYLVGSISTEKIPNSLVEIVDPWIVTAMSIAACRMILNMQEIASIYDLATNEDDNISTAPVQLTTNVLFFESQMMPTIVTGSTITNDLDIETCARTGWGGDEIELREIGKLRG